MEESWGMDLVRGFFAAIDRAIYGLMSTIYQIILELAELTILSPGVIKDMYTRIYALLAIFMLFKITFSFVNYVINPDQFTDKQRGVQHLIKNVIIVLIMIIITPFAFGKLSEAQSAILHDKLIPKLIVGAGTGEEGNQSFATSFSMSDDCGANNATIEDDGDYLALVTFRPFYQLENPSSMPNSLKTKYCPSNKNMTISDYLVSDIYNKAPGVGGLYSINYKFFVSTIVGIVVCLILISFCFDVAVRSIKLAFLQMIAPIPILSYVDPASSKNGMFSKWLKQVGATWVSLFVRLIAIFFAVLVISMIDMKYIEGQVGEHKFWVMLFVLIGALIFAKQLPKLLEELIPGLKLGGMQLNPFKKVADQALGGNKLLGLGAAGLGAGLASISNIGSRIKAQHDMNKEMDQIPEKSESYKEFKRKFDSYKARHGLSDDEYNRILGLKLDKEKQKIHDKYNKNFSFKHPVLSNFSQTFSGARIAFNQGKNLRFDPIEIGKQSSNIKDWKDQHDIKDRTMEKITDFFGIKNDTGTTSIAKQEIKDLNDKLTRNTRALEMQNKALSDMQSKMGPAEFAKALTRDNKGNYMVNQGYTGMHKADLEAIVNTMSQLETERLALTKEINRQEKIRDKEMPKPGKK